MDNIKLAKSSQFLSDTGPTYRSNLAPWSSKVDRLQFDSHSVYQRVVDDCRFFYKHEPTVYTVINKMVDLAINDLIVVPEDTKVNKTEKQIFKALSDDILKFLRKTAFEYLITGMSVPEITLTRIGEDELRDKGIQRITSLLYPTDMWVRNSRDIEIKKPMVSSRQSYFILVPEETIFFLQNKGKYPDGTSDVATYNAIIRDYPDLVRRILTGETKILLDNPLIVKYTELSDSQYPIPYLYAALESAKQKRSMKKMDYSITARVISAILHVTAGNDNFPLTEDQKEFLDDLEIKFKWRDNFNIDDVERVFTLFTNHTVALNWVLPDVTTLLNDKKYDPVNKDIILALGFPRILVTGETERSFSSDPEIATLSPINTLRVMRADLLPIAKKIFIEMRNNNDSISSVPEIKFKPINLMSLQLFYDGIAKLYESGNLSRHSFTDAYGYDFDMEAEEISEEQKTIKESGLPEFAPVPHSNTPGQGAPGQTKPAPEKKPAKAKPTT